MSSKKSKKPTICLAAICKNEAKIIKRMLASALPFVDYVVIQDTGSTDGTLDTIQNYLDEHFGPGEAGYDLYEEPWTNFAVNRSSLVKKAQEVSGCDYLLLLDADHEIIVADGALDNLDKDQYQVRFAGDLSYFLPYIVKASLPWRYICPTHEYITVDREFSSEKLKGVYLEHYCDGGTRPEKSERDINLLQVEYEINPDDQRVCFYLAQSFQDAGRTEEAIDLYLHRASLGGWVEETYVSLLRVARMRDNLEDYMKAWCHLPHRPEALHGLIKKLNGIGCHTAVVKLVENNPTDTFDLLFVEQESHKVGIRIEYGVALWYTGNVRAAKMCWEDLSHRDDLNDGDRELITTNLSFCEGV